MPFATPPEIQTARLVIRLVQPSDLDDLLVVNGDEAVTQHLPYATWASMADAQAWYERMQRLQEAGTALQFVVLERASGRAIGTCLLFRLDEGSSRAELGYVLGRAAWGQGYMQEALQAVVSTAFTVLGLRRLEAEINPVNAASTRLIERLGFVREGLLRQRWVAKGRAYDVAVYGLLRDERDARTTNQGV